MRGLSLAIVLALGLTSSTAQAKGFAVEIVSGIEQKRKLSTSGTTAIPRVRKLAPGDEVITVVVKVPDAWLKAPGAEAAAVVVAQNAGEIDEVIKALQKLKLLEPTLPPVALASRIAGVFQVADVGSALRPLDARLWHAWEVLVDAEHTDTLSAAVASAQALEQLTIKARVCSYQAEAGAAFGVVVDGTATASLQDSAFKLEDSASSLVTVHPRGKPKGTLSTSSMHCSTVIEVSDPAFKPGGGLKPIPVPTPPTPTSPTSPAPPRLIEPPSLEDQVDALGLDPLQDDRLWYGLSAVGFLAVFLVAGFAMQAALRRSKRAQKLSEQRKQRRF